MTDEPNPRARTDRAEETAGRRKDRYEAMSGDPSLRRFGVPDKFLDTKNFVYRSVADDGKTRLLELTQNDDYDFVTKAGDEQGKAGDRGAKGVVKYQHGSNLDGSPQYTYLLRKPIEFATEDRAKKVAEINAKESAILSGRERPDGAPDNSYTPKR